MKTRNNPFLRSNALILAGSIAMLFGGGSAQAVNITRTLTTTGANNLSTAAWTGGAPTNLTIGDMAVYSTATTASTTTVNVNATLGGFRTNNTGVWTIAPGAGILTLDATGLISGNTPFGNAATAFLANTSTVAGGLTVNSAIGIANTNLDIGTTSSGSIVLGGAITASSAQNLNFRANNTGAITVSSNIGATGSNIAISNLGTNSGGTTLSGVLGSFVTTVTQNSATSALTLSGANTYTGATTVNLGTLSLTGSLSSSSALALGGGTFTFSNATGGITQTMNGLTVNVGSSTVNNTVISNTLDLGAISRTVAGSSVNFGTTTGAITTSTTGTNSILGTWASFGTGANTKYATGGGTIAGLTGTAAATGADLTDTTGAVNYDLAAGGGTVPATVSANTIRYTGGAGATAPDASFTVNGLMNAGTGIWTIGTNALTIGGNKELVVNAANNAITISSAIGNNGGGASALTKTGSSTLTLSGANSYTGATTVGQGILNVGGGTAAGDLGSSSGVTLSGTGALTFNRTNTYSYTNAITGGGVAGGNTLTQAGAGALTLGNVTGVQTITRSALTGALTLGTITGIGTLTDMSGSGSTTPTTLNQTGTGLTIGAINGANGSRVIFQGAGSTTITSQLTQGGQTVNVSAGTVSLGVGRNVNVNLIVSGGTLTTTGTNRLSMANNDSQTLSITSGTLNVLSTADFGARLGADNGPANATGIGFTGTQSGGTFNALGTQGFALGSAAASKVASYSLSGTGILNVGSSALPQNFTLGADTLGTGTTTFNLSGGKLLVSGTISGSQVTGAKQAFVFTGGTLAAGTYTATNLTSAQGTAVVTGATNTLTNAGGTLAPGDTGTGGKTTITGNYTQNSGTLAIDLGGTTIANAFQTGVGTYDTTTVSGALTLGGTLNVSLINSFAITSSQSFTIITGATSVSGSFANLDESGRVNLLTGGSMLVTNVPGGVTLSGYSTGASLVWAGNGGTNAWDVNSTSGFTNGGLSSVFKNGDVAIFNNSGLGNSTVNLSTTVSPGGVAFANTSGTYTVTGSGGIGGTGTLTKSGAGTVVLATANTFTGGLVINAGVVTLANAGALNTTAPNAVTFGGSAPAGTKLQLGGYSVSVGALSTAAITPVIENASGTAATLTVTGTGTYAGVLQNGTGVGALALTKASNSALTLTGLNTYTGATAITNAAGTLTFSNVGNQSLGALDGVGTVVNAAGSGTLAFNQAAGITTYSIGTLTNSTTTGAAGAFTLNAGAGSTTTIGTINGAIGSVVNLGGDSTGITSITNGVNAPGQTVNFTAGTVNLNGTGAHRSNLVFNGATVSTRAGNVDYNQITSFNMSAGSFLAQSIYGFRMGSNYGATNGATNAFTGTQSGGTFNINSWDGFQMGGNSGSFVSSYALSAGTLNVTGGNFNLGANPLGTGSTTFTLSGGKLIASGTINGSQGSGAVQNFVFNGGQLTAGAINLTNLTTSGATAGVPATLANNGGTLAPGDIGTGGKTDITGSYSVTSASASYAVDLGSAVAATAFQNGVGTYDTTNVSGALALGGTLNVSFINGFTPANTDTFTILTGASITGGFSNVSGGKLALTGGATFDVTSTGTAVTLSNYTDANSNTYASWIAGFNVGGQTGANDDFDHDGLSNSVENVLGSNPSVYSAGLTQVSATANSVIFRHNQSNTIATGVTKTYQWSLDLVTWAASGATIAGTTATIGAVTITDAVAPANDLIEVTVTITGGPATKLFGRLVATKAP